MEKTIGFLAFRISKYLILAFLFPLLFSCQKEEATLSLEEKEIPELSSLKVGPMAYTGNYTEFEWLIDMPENWNAQPRRVMMLYAHGMVDPVPFEPVKLPSDSLGGKAIRDIVLAMEMGYATTSYRDNGLVVLDAVEDIKDLVGLVELFFEANPEYLPPHFLFLAGPSEGGLITTLTLEKYPELFQGGISICGPIGDFKRQLQYNGDFHVLFNYFFGEELQAQGVDLGNPEDGVNPLVMQAWKDGSLKLLIIDILRSNPGKVMQLVKTTNLPVNPTDEEAIGTAIMEVLRFNIMLTNDVTIRMGGVPYSNVDTQYMGSDDDELLNQMVQRIHGTNYDQAMEEVQKYETDAAFKAPLATIHTFWDHVTPFWHQSAFRLKVLSGTSWWLHTPMAVGAFGHCNIEEFHIMAALGITISQALVLEYFEIPETAFDNEQLRAAFENIMGENGVPVRIKK